MRSHTLMGATVALVTLGALFLAPSTAWADGCFIPRIGTAVANTAAQQALLVYGESETKLVLRTGYRGNGQPFSWVIPTKGLLRAEDVSTVSPIVFQTLGDYSAPQFVPYELACGTSMGCAADGEGDEADVKHGVTVFESFRAGPYDIVVLDAEESRGLVDWLEENEYDVPDEEAAAEVFDDYVLRGFSFVAVKVAPVGYQQPAEGEGEGQGQGGFGAEGEGEEDPGDSADALVMRFPGAMRTFPFLVSSLSTIDQVDVLLYVLSDTRYRTVAPAFYTFEMTMPATYDQDDFQEYYDRSLEERLAEVGGPGFALEFAGPLPDVLIESLGYSNVLEGAPDATFLTRLHSRLGPVAMDRDIELEPVTGEAATRRHRVRVITGYRGTEEELVAALPLDLLVILGLAWLARRSRRGGGA